MTVLQTFQRGGKTVDTVAPFLRDPGRALLTLAFLGFKWTPGSHWGLDTADCCWISCPVGLRRELRSCFSRRFSSEPDAADPGITLWESGVQLTPATLNAGRGLVPDTAAAIPNIVPLPTFAPAVPIGQAYHGAFSTAGLVEPHVLFPFSADDGAETSISSGCC